MRKHNLFNNQKTLSNSARLLSGSFHILLAAISLFPVSLFAQEDTLHVKLSETEVLGHRNEVEGQSYVKLRGKALLRAPLFMGEKDVLRSLQLLPGVDAVSDGSSAPSIRGGTSDQSLLLLDGTPFFNASHAYGLISVVDANIIESAELFKGVFPGQYGGRLSGIVNLQTRTLSDNKLHGGISVGTISAAANLEVPLIKDKTYALFSARKSTIDLLLKGAGAISDDLSVPQPSFGDIYGKVIHKFSKDNQLSVSGFYTDDHLNMSSKDAGYRMKYAFSWRTYSGEANWKYKLNDRVYLQSDFYYAGLQNKSKTYIKDKELNIDETQVSKIGEFSVRQSLNWRLTDHLFGAGIAFSQTHFDPIRIESSFGNTAGSSSSLRQLSTTTIWLEDRWSIGSAWSVNPILRATVYSNRTNVRTLLDPRLKVNYQLDHSNSFEANFNMSSQPIDLLRQSSLNFPMDFWTPFADDKIARSGLISLGWKNTFVKNTEFMIEGYYKRIKDQRFIYSFNDFVNYDGGSVYLKGKAYGIETSLRWNPAPFQFMLSYTYSRSLSKLHNEWSGNYQDIPHRVTLWGDYGFALRKKKKANLSFLLNYHTGTPFVLPEGFYPSVDGSHMVGSIPVLPNFRSKRYFRLDINYSITRQLKRGTGTWQFAIMNLTAHRNPYMIYHVDKGYKMMVMIPFLPSVAYRFEF